MANAVVTFAVVYGVGIILMMIGRGIYVFLPWFCMRYPRTAEFSRALTVALVIFAVFWSGIALNAH